MEEMVMNQANIEAVDDVVDELVTDNKTNINTYLYVGGIAAAGYLVGKGIEWGIKKAAPVVKKTFKKIFKKDKKSTTESVVEKEAEEEIDLHNDEFPEFND